MRGIAFNEIASLCFTAAAADAVDAAADALCVCVVWRASFTIQCNSQIECKWQ